MEFSENQPNFLQRAENLSCPKRKKSDASFKSELQAAALFPIWWLIQMITYPEMKAHK